jgi:sugar lactone lactonase YvrE
MPGPERAEWNPLGLRFDAEGNLMITNLVAGKHEVLIFPAASLTGDLSKFAPAFKEFGSEGKENGQFSFPNSVVRDSKGNYYVSDGNNGRISAWSAERIYKSYFGFGSSDQTLNLPRGAWMDNKDHLHIADAVGSAIRVYDVSGSDPAFLYNFGEFGVSEGYLNFPVDITLDSTGRVYIADRENNRIDIWSY